MLVGALLLLAQLLLHQHQHLLLLRHHRNHLLFQHLLLLQQHLHLPCWIGGKPAKGALQRLQATWTLSMSHGSACRAIKCLSKTRGTQTYWLCVIVTFLCQIISLSSMISMIEQIR